MVAKSILFDGKTLSTIDHRRKHFEQTAVAASAVTASIAFFAGPPPAQLAFDTSGRFGGKGDVVLELIPKTGPHLEWVVDPRDWHVRASIVVEANGDTTELELFSPDDQRVVRPGWFVLAPATLPGYSHP